MEHFVVMEGTGVERAINQGPSLLICDDPIETAYIIVRGTLTHRLWHDVDLARTLLPILLRQTVVTKHLLSHSGRCLPSSEFDFCPMVDVEWSFRTDLMAIVGILCVASPGGQIWTAR